jgi:hypothetical protein
MSASAACRGVGCRTVPALAGAAVCADSPQTRHSPTRADAAA